VPTAKVVIQSISVTPENARIGIGDSHQFTALAVYSDHKTFDITETAVWSSSDIIVAAIDSGAAIGRTEGVVEIRARLQETVSDPAVLTVAGAPVPVIRIDAETDTIPVGTTLQMAATAIYASGSTSDVTATAAWLSSNGVVAAIESGLITGLSAGEAEITASWGGAMSKPFALTVTPVMPWALIGGIIGALLAAGLLLYALLRRRHNAQTA
jgi:uncharacterized protein YjdB